jgi:ABC-type transport system substrate-binding protein
LGVDGILVAVNRFLISILFFLSLCVNVSRGECVFRRPLERVASMDPIQASAIYSSQAISLVYETILQVDYYARPYKLRPGLCYLPEISSDALSYTFKIVPGSRFHPDPCFQGEAAKKGRLVRADDIIYSLSRLKDKSNASSGMWVMAAVTNMVALDDETVQIQLLKRLHVFPWMMALSYTAAVPREAIEKYGSKFGSVAVGSGPYRLSSWRRNHAMSFARFPEWRGWNSDSSTSFDEKMNPVLGKPLDVVKYLVIDDVSTQWLMFLSGGVDFLASVPRDNWDAVIGKDGKLLPSLVSQGVRLHEHPTLSVIYIGINMRDPILGKNKKLRQALNCAFDFKAWSKFFNNRILESTGPIPQGVAGRVETPFNYSYNLKKAKTLLAEAGYPNGIDPVTNRRLVLQLGIGRANQDAREQAELLQSFFEKIGIRLEPVYMTWEAFLKATSEGRLPLFNLGWVGDYPDAENFMQLFYSKNLAPGPNRCGYSNPEFDKIYDTAMAEISESKRNEYWKEAQEIIREDCPWVFLHVQKTCSLTRKELEGYKPGDFQYGSEKYFRVKKKGEK